MKLSSTLQPVSEKYYKTNTQIQVSALYFVIWTEYVPDLTFKFLIFASF
jgi:hypothetical protein